MVEKKHLGVERGVESYSKTLNNLSKEQQEIYLYLVKDFLTPKQIALKRNTSLNAVYKTISKLKNYNIINKNYNKIGGLNKNRGWENPKIKELRLHNQRFTIEILEKTQFFLNLLKTKNRTSIENNTIFIYENELVIYSNKDFWGHSVDNCFEQSSLYWNNFLRTLENDLNIILIKPRKCNIKDFGCHIARINDTLAKEINFNKDQLKIYAPDGKLRLIVDNSFNLNEFEAVHKETAPKDMKKIEKHYKEILENNLLSPLEIHKIIQENEKFKAEILVMIGTLINQIKNK